jgi:predicted transport protein
VSDIKLFKLAGAGVSELRGTSVAVERSLQDLMERHLEAFLGVRFVASEYSTGRVHGGRIDTLGIDEDNSPVIIEYKRSTNQNVINQGLFYLDWLLDHKAEFKFLVMEKLGRQAEVDWSNPRLICIAGNFTRYDEHAVRQINRNIELVRYRRYDEGFLLLELVTPSGSTEGPSDLGDASGGGSLSRPSPRSVDELYSQAGRALKDIFEALEEFLLSLGDDVTKKTLKYYYAFRRIKNFACVEVHPQQNKLVVFTKVDPSTVELVEGFTRDVTGVGHLGTGNLELTIRSLADLERAQPLLLASYESS